ncbi:MAG: hypothetical protein KBT34_05625 [Prevotella sp.]|nr:hypothetical protein [Candidatus Prevotella equi]
MMNVQKYKETTFRAHKRFVNSMYAYKTLTSNLSDMDKLRLDNIIAQSYHAGFNDSQGYMSRILR